MLYSSPTHSLIYKKIFIKTKTFTPNDDIIIDKWQEVSMDNAKRLGLYLGLKRDEITPFDIINLSRKGIKASFAKKLIKAVQINQEEFADYLGFKIRTLSRRFEKPTEKMTSEESEKVIRLARVFLQALDIFEDEMKVASWLKRPNRSLADLAPISYLDSDIGAEEVMASLGRIKDGVYS